MFADTAGKLDESGIHSLSGRNSTAHTEWINPIPTELVRTQINLNPIRETIPIVEFTLDLSRDDIPAELLLYHVRHGRAMPGKVRLLLALLILFGVIGRVWLSRREHGHAQIEKLSEKILVHSDI